MPEGLPRAVTTEHEFLAAVCGRLDTLIALIGERLPGQAARPESPADEPRPVVLREPDPAPADTSRAHANTDPTGEPGPEPQPAKTTTRPARTGRRTTKASK